MAFVNASRTHLGSLEKALQSPQWYRDERLWSFLSATLIAEHPEHLVTLLCSRDTPTNAMQVFCEAEPLSTRVGEGNTVVDIAFGHLEPRWGTSRPLRAGIQYGPPSDQSWVCFVEAKLFSDLGYRVANDPARNQLARNIENLLCFQTAGQVPSRLHFVLLTPRAFKDHPKARFYGYKFQDYQNTKQAILDDIASCPLNERRTPYYQWPDRAARLEALAELRWVAFEELFEVAGLSPALPDILACARHPDAKSIHDEINRRVREALQRNAGAHLPNPVG